ncbi:hypothetical protein MTO96_009488 [Rhipicephalus appendiculatus]
MPKEHSRVGKTTTCNDATANPRKLSCIRTFPADQTSGHCYSVRALHQTRRHVRGRENIQALHGAKLTRERRRSCVRQRSRYGELPTPGRAREDASEE